MRPLTVRSRHFPPRPYDAITLFPFVIHRGATLSGRTLRHETVHLCQQAALLVVFFYLLYGLFYVVNLVRFRNHDRAYRAIPFERSAYAIEACGDAGRWRMATGWLHCLRRP